MKRVLLSLSLFLAFVLVSMSAQAAIVFEQLPSPAAAGLVSANDGIMGGDFRVYDDFRLTTGATVNQITWWGVPAGDATDFTFTFYANNSSTNLPGDFICSYSGSTTGLLTNIIDMDKYSTNIMVYSVNLGSGHYFAAGTTYWLSIYSETEDYVSWGWQVAGGTASYQAPQHPLNDTNSNVAFQFYANPVPLPAAVWLLGPGLAGLAALRCRRKMR